MKTVKHTEIVGFDSGFPEPACVVICKRIFINNLDSMYIVLTLPVAVKNFCGAIFPI